ncbi:MAG: FG-GAP-like repeat-containing protein [Acidobacteriota bacterium]|nr:FG-GAP-like repeat-containing protein [Acidobacteriota bacterium]
MMWILLFVMLGSEPGPQDLADNNRGVGLMGSFEYEAAAEVFGKLVDRHPKQPVFLTNLAIATLNRQGDGDEARAMALLDRVLAEDPEDARANYCRGLLLIYAGREDEAMPHFEKVIERDPRDAFAHYQVAQILARRSEGARALELYRRSIRLDPYFQSAYYGAFRALQQQGKRQEARNMVKQFQRLKNNPRGYAFEFKYTRMGPKAMVETLDLETPLIERPEGPLFNAPIAWLSGKAPEHASISVCDFDHDGDPDVFIPGLLDGKNAVLINDKGAYRNDPKHPLASVTGVNGILWGDTDNDGLTDAYLLRKGPNALWRQTAEGWQDITAQAGVGGQGDSVDGAMVDADHDGDLDLLVVHRDGPTELFNNNRDGSWRPLAAEFGLAGDGKPARNAALGDLDGDRDVDLIVLKENTPHEVFINDRLWEYRAGEGFDAFRKEAAVACITADLDSNGELDILTQTPAGVLRVWKRNSENQWAATDLATGTKPAASPRLGVIDADGDGRWEIVFNHPKGWTVITSEGKKLFEADGKEPAALAPLTTADIGAGPGLLEVDRAGALRFHAPGKGRYPFIVLGFSGKQDQTGGMRSNASGIGTEVAVRVGSSWTMASGFPAFNDPGQSLQPLSLGLAGRPRVDFVAMTWSDGVFQTEQALEAGKQHGITEAQRQLASCPVMFAWDGKRFRFISDVLGVGGIGFATGRGTYAAPRPFERFLMPQDALAPKDGRFKIKIGEPMEEVCYLDRAALIAWDIPEGRQIALDERMHLEGPPPSGKPLFYRNEHLPVAATDAHGNSILERLAEADHRAQEIGPLDTRFLGLLAEDLVTELVFEKPLDQIRGQVALMIDGWVEYPYSQTMFAAWQAGAAYRAPKLEARDPQGRLHVIMPAMGYPAGMPRRMTVPLPPLPEGTVALRITTNLQVYWDRISVIETEPCPDAVRRELPLVAAELTRPGFAKRTNGPQMLPQYDYSKRDTFWDTRHMEGAYTRFGNVLPLVSKGDHVLAVFGPGEEVQLDFKADLPPPAPGFTRRYVLDLAGWCKDMDLYTLTGETVAPLPGKRDSEQEKLQRRFNTRYRAGF